MATIRAIIRTTKKNADVNIRFRISDGREVQLFHASDISLNVDIWDSKNECVKVRALVNEDKRNSINRAIIARKQLLSDLYEANKNNAEPLTSEQLDVLVDEVLHPEKYKKESDSFFDIFDEYLERHKLSDVREKNFYVLVRALKRYELFYQSYHNQPNYQLDIHTISAKTIEDIESFLRNEHSLYDEYPHIFESFPAIANSKRKSPKPKPRGHNTICALFNKFRAFTNWCIEEELTTNNPFKKYSGITSEVYGTPYFLTLGERNQIADYDLSEFPHLEAQRDIFIFQCLIGCRVSDLLKMTPHSVVNGAIEYIPTKTKTEKPIVVRVPLNKRAKELVDKYKGGHELFPFISAQKYNDSIKEIFSKCGVNRMVTTINPTTGEEEKRLLNEIASSHIARRTFIGNIYRKVKDPNLVGKISGHAEGSKAFARYRDIDEDMKRELVDILE